MNEPSRKPVQFSHQFVLPEGRKAHQPYAPILSIVTHLVVIVLLLKYGAPAEYRDTSKWLSADPGSLGQIKTHSVTFSATASAGESRSAISEPVDQKKTPKIPQLAIIPEPDIVPVIKPVALAAVDSQSGNTAATSDSGTGADSGKGAESGAGGSGSGAGNGNGNGSGTGTGAGKARAPDPKQFIVPPADRPAALRGTTIEVTFMVSSAGKVDKVVLEPRPRDEKFRGRLEAILLGYRFRPARDSTGASVAGTFTIRLTL